MLFLNGGGFISTVVTGYMDKLRVGPQGSGEGLPPGAVLVVSLSGIARAQAGYCGHRARNAGAASTMFDPRGIV